MNIFRILFLLLLAGVHPANLNSSETGQDIIIYQEDVPNEPVWENTDPIIDEEIFYEEDFEEINVWELESEYGEYITDEYFDEQYDGTEFTFEWEEESEQEEPEDAYQSNYENYINDSGIVYDVDVEGCPGHDYVIEYVACGDSYYITYWCPYCLDYYEVPITQEEWESVDLGDD